MDESELNRLGKLRLALFLAADDRDHAIAAARALQTEAHNVHLMRALETAITVSYMRAFTQSKLKTLPDEYVPTTSPDAELHKWFDERRDQTYAHTDKTSGRDASVKLLEVEGEVVPIEWRVEWISFPRAWIEPAIDLFERQRDHFRTEAVRIQQKIETSGPFVSGVRPEQKAENER